MKNITLTPVTSSQISAIGHDPETKTLRIQFATKNPEKPGSIYDYSNFSEEDYANFLKSESKGKFFGAFIKSSPAKYPYTKVTTPAPGQ